MASRELKDLSEEMQSKALLFDEQCKKRGIDYLRYCTYRSTEEQSHLYEIGRTLPGKIVTNAKGGESKHNVTTPDGQPAAQAWDGVPLINGKPLWSLYIKDTTGRDMIHPVWKRVLEIGHSIGLKSGMDFKGKFKEAPHWENPNV